MAAKCAYTAGELGSLFFLKEVDYGKTPTGTMKAGLYSTAWQRQDDKHRYRQYLPGSRSYDVNTSVDQGNDVAFSVSGPLRAATVGIDWAEPLISGAFGIPSGSSIATGDLDILPSYSILMQLGSTAKANLEQVLYNGCKVNTLNISADQPKAVIAVNATVFAQFAEKLAASKATKLQTMDITTATDAITSRPAAIQWNSGIKVGTTDFYPESWSISVDNGLGRTSGPLIGADTNTYVGTRCLTEGQRNITLSMVCWFKDYKIIEDQLDNAKAGNVEIPLSNGKKITLSNNRYTLSLPEHIQDRHQITVNLDCAEAAVV